MTIKKGDNVITEFTTQVFEVIDFLEEDVVILNDGGQVMVSDCYLVPNQYDKDIVHHPHLPPDIASQIIQNAKCKETEQFIESFDDDEDWDAVEDWELLGLDPDTPQEEIDDHWENQM
jgi:hypothetical protein